MEATTTYQPVKFFDLEQALDFARKESQAKKDAFFVIYDYQLKCWFVDDSSFTRSFEKLEATFDGGKRIYD